MALGSDCKPLSIIAESLFHTAEVDRYFFFPKLNIKAEMIYVESLILPSEGLESGHFDSYSPTYFKSIYPFKVLSYRGLEGTVKFKDITIFSGGNGTGKSTLLNILAQKLGLKRTTPFNHTVLFDEYMDYCRVRMSDLAYNLSYQASDYGRIITSDEVFEHILVTRYENDEIDNVRLGMLDRIEDLRNAPPRSINFDDKDSVKDFRDSVDARRLSISKYVKKHLGFNKVERSNGENGFKYFTDTIQPQGLYLLDEPENSLSVERQLDLCLFIDSMARYENCQFIISTHSPFIMSIKNALLYNLDVFPATTMKWSEVESVRQYYEFFKSREDEFK